MTFKLGINEPSIRMNLGQEKHPNVLTVITWIIWPCKLGLDCTEGPPNSSMQGWPTCSMHTKQGTGSLCVWHMAYWGGGREYTGTQGREQSSRSGREHRVGSRKQQQVKKRKEIRRTLREAIGLNLWYTCQERLNTRGVFTCALWVGVACFN